MITSNKIFKLPDKACSSYVEGFTNKSKFVSAFKKDFGYVRAYHATNINEPEIDHIRKNGLVPSSRELLRSKAVARFIKTTDTDKLKTEVAQAVDHYIQNQDYICETEINFGLIKQPFIDNWYQYLLFGPESLIALASDLRIKHGINFRERMRDYGSHCIIEATVPVVGIKRMWIEAIYEYINGSFDECNLVYHKNVPSAFLKISKVRAPADFHNFLYC